MAGKKGRSGKITTPEQRQRRAAAASLGGIARWAKADAREAPPEQPVLTPEQAAAAERAGAGKIPPPITWREALQRMNAGVAALKREKLQLEIETLKRDRIPAAEVREFLARQHAAIMREVSTLSGLADQIPEARPHQTEALRAALLAFAEQFRRTLTEIEL